ncbi:MAG: cysteine--tRNA ligase [Thermoplasmatales archaeon]|jgi:cysteinyl-tRNA synthetase|nr:cysteine--tRNA ligase [Candidatus Thermoplasmatota archaeon]MCL6002115.1 cysteine--tRNA ligase [Candidatus Thermoplasmatota archaeon]MDA8055282.1 cysteine--tRNA ligase [Thermoplasmatales archaeon]
MEVRDTLSSSMKKIEVREGRRLTMFVCGPTVQDKPHMGHARTYIFYDVLARYLRFKGIRLFYLMNITDIEDHVIDKMKETGRSWEDIIATYSSEFFNEMRKLKNNSVNYHAFATDYIEEIIKQISKLMKKGYAYEIPDGVYYRVRNFKDYGKLSKQNLDDLRAGARVEVNEEKEDPLDFALWKKKKEGEPSWSSPWGEGRPGWHIEDTAITESIFGPQYDIHGGAKDLIFPHHESEIAQMEAISRKKPMVKYWIHTGHLNVDDIKMSKSLKNFVTVEEALKNYWPEAIRIMMLSMKYSAAVNFDEKAAIDAQGTAEKIAILQRRVNGSSEMKSDKAIETVERILSPLENDMNTPETIREIVGYVKSSLAKSKLSEGERGEIKYVLNQVESVMGIVHMVPFPDRSMDIILDLRNELRKKGDYESADKIRGNLKSLGIRIEDTVEGSYLWW